MKGKRVAISTFGSGSHLAVEVALQHLGMEVGARQNRDHAGRHAAGAMAAVVAGRMEATALGTGIWPSGEGQGTQVMLTDLTKSDTPYVNTVMWRAALRQRRIRSRWKLFSRAPSMAWLHGQSRPTSKRDQEAFLPKRLKLSTPQAIQIMYDATVQIHAKTKVPNTRPGRRAKHDRLLCTSESTPGQTQGRRYDRQLFRRPAG